MKGFDWGIALPRWLGGLVSGAAIGLTQDMGWQDLCRSMLVGWLSLVAVDLGMWGNASRNTEE